MSEIIRQKRVIDMMLTAHSILSDRYHSYATISDNTLLIASSVLNVFVFVDAKFLSNITNLNEEKQRLVIGIASVVVFCISIILLQVKWKEKSENHAKAIERLFVLKQHIRSVIDMEGGDDKKAFLEQFQSKYTEVMSGLVKIPDSKFNSLKLIHYRKIELSKLIDKYPGSRLFILKFRLFLSSLKG